MELVTVTEHLVDFAIDVAIYFFVSRSSRGIWDST